MNEELRKGKNKVINDIMPFLLTDAYKIGHIRQYPEDTTMVYSNFTARKGRTPDTDGIVFFGLQYFLEEYLESLFNNYFFDKDKEYIKHVYQRRMDSYLGPGIPTHHLEKLWDLGYLPLHIKALPEGSFVPYGVPVLTIRNTSPEFYWLTNALETLMSNVLWMASTSATTAYLFRKNFLKYAEETVGDDLSFVPWQGHDFSFRGMSGIEAAMISGAAHLLSFTGTDTIPAIDFLERYYDANSDLELIGGSVPATEHSVMCMGTQEDEMSTFKRLITETYPEGIVSVVSDTWDLWKVLTEYMPALKNEVLARNGKLVIRPDSGDPVNIVCGDPNGKTEEEKKGVIQLLWETFGGTTTQKGYRLLDSHIGMIYGDGISLARQEEMLSRLKANNFCSYNVVLGIGSYTYQHTTRDTHGFAMKATAGETRSRGLIEIFKDPVTDRGPKSAGKKSAKGLLMVTQDQNGRYQLVDQVPWSEEQHGCLETVYLDGEIMRAQTLSEIREVVSKL